MVAIVCTHAHDDHVNAAPALADGQRLPVAGIELEVIHTPGHAPGAVCLYAPAVGALLSGDTLFQGGPGATGRSHSDFPTIIASIRNRLLALPPDTVVHPGHGEGTTVGPRPQTSTPGSSAATDPPPGDTCRTPP